MTLYREDTTEIAVAADHIFVMARVFAYERAYAKDKQRYAVKIKTIERAYAADSGVFKKGLSTQERAYAADHSQTQHLAKQWTVDKARARDHFRAGSNDFTIETAIAKDVGRYSHKIKTKETAFARDFNLSRLKLLTIEKAFARDQIKGLSRIDCIEQAVASDSGLQKLKAFARVVERATAQDIDRSEIRGQGFTVESAAARDVVWSKLYAIQYTQDVAFADDIVGVGDTQAQVWTAHMNTWAMSRYAPFNFDGAAVINEQLYFYRQDGVYQYGIEGEVIDAAIQTAPLDFGEALVHPLAYYMEYSLSGADKRLDIGVTTTQSGTSQRYVYTLAKETADMLTNGRVQFGRGLRGRHFAFDIQLHGTAGTLNAQSVDYSPTARRI